MNESEIPPVKSKKIITISIVVLIVIGVLFAILALWQEFSDGGANTEPALSQHEAITIVQVMHPELLAYPSDDLPPRHIETEATPDGGWHIGFMTTGSGRPGILEAACYHLSSSQEVTKIGEFKAGADAPSIIDLTTCTP